MYVRTYVEQFEDSPYRRTSTMREAPGGVVPAAYTNSVDAYREFISKRFHNTELPLVHLNR